MLLAIYQLMLQIAWTLLHAAWIALFAEELQMQLNIAQPSVNILSYYPAMESHKGYSLVCLCPEELQQ